MALPVRHAGASPRIRKLAFALPRGRTAFCVSTNFGTKCARISKKLQLDFHEDNTFNTQT